MFMTVIAFLERPGTVNRDGELTNHGTQQATGTEDKPWLAVLLGPDHVGCDRDSELIESSKPVLDGKTEEPEGGTAEISRLEEWYSSLAKRTLVKLPPMTPHLLRPGSDLGEVIDDLLAFPAHPLFKLGLLLEAFASQLIEELHPAVMPSPLVERLAVFGFIGVIGA
jgi:hypothetical protein